MAVKVACIQPRLRVGDIAFNIGQVVDCAVRARDEGAELVLVPHLALLGGRIMEGWGDEVFIEHVQHKAMDELQRRRCGVMLLVSGRLSGRLVAYVIPEGEGSSPQLLGLSNTLQLPTGESICVDWCGDEARQRVPLGYKWEACSLLVIFDTSYDGGGRNALVADWRPSMPAVAVRHGGIMGHHLCARGSEFATAEGVLCHGCRANSVWVIDTACPESRIEKMGSEEEIWYGYMVQGVREFFSTQGLRRALVGLSGGIDSAVVLAVAVEALGTANVMAVFMPSQFSSQASADDAALLASRLGVAYHVVPIDTLCGMVENTLGSLLDGVRGTAEENIQARLRGLLLMAIANKQGYALLNTSNKSEVAVGYSTMYGDMCGVLCVMGDLYKTQVYRVAHWINRTQELIPSRIITRAPSAELRANQSDQDSLPPYELLDTILQQLLDGNPTPLCDGIQEMVVERVKELVAASAFKRQQMPPILKWTRHPFHADVDSWVAGAQWL